MSRSFSANFRGVSPCILAEKTLVEICDFYFSLRKNLVRARGVPRRKAKKEYFSWADLYILMNLEYKRMSDLSLCLAHISFVGFCSPLALVMFTLPLLNMGRRMKKTTK